MMARVSLALLLLAMALPPASGSEEFQTGIEKLAEGVFKSTKGEAVIIGHFVPLGFAGPKNFNSGPGIETALTTALLARDKGAVRDEENTKYEIGGTYALVPEVEGPFKGFHKVKIRANVIDRKTSETIIVLPIDLRESESIMEVVQVSAALPPSDNHENRLKRNEEIVAKTKRPSVHVDGPEKSLVSSGPESPYAIEVRAKGLNDSDARPFVPRPVKVEKGLAFVEVGKDELFDVQVFNRSGEPVAVSLSVDGLDMFHFSKDRDPDNAARPRFTHFIMDDRLGTGAKLTLPGWHDSVNEEKFLQFLVTSYGAGAAKKAGLPARGGSVGVLHVQFSKCSPLKDGENARGDNAAGFGPAVHVPQKVVRYQIEPPIDAVSVRYLR